MADAAAHRREKSFENRRGRFSLVHAVVVGAMALAALLASLCFDFGNGGFVAGVKPALAYLAFPPFGFGCLVVGALAARLALLVGRRIGTTPTLLVAGGLLTAGVIHSGMTSQPLARFRRLVWADAPGTIRPLACEARRSFNDGTVYLFSFSATPEVIERMNDEVGLVKMPASHGLSPRPRLRTQIAERAIPGDAEYHQRGNIELLHLPSTHEAVVAVFP